MDNEWRSVVLPANKSGPSVYNVYNTEKQNVTQDIENKGLFYHFYNIPTTPDMLGYDQLTFEDLDDNTSTYKIDELILL
jgi:hypothetical protein